MARLFVAIDLPQEVINETIKIQNILKKEDFFQAKYVEIEHFHLTLNFLGEVEESKIGQLKNILENIKFPSFKANLENVGYFPKEKIKIIWIGIESQELIELQKIIQNKLIDLIDLKNEPFIAHLTIARIQSIKNPEKLKNFIEKIKLSKVEFTINSFILKDSKLTNNGAIHTNLQIYYLE